MRHHEVGDGVVDFTREENNSVLEQTGVDIVGTFSSPRLFDDHRNELVSYFHRFSLVRDDVAVCP